MGCFKLKSMGVFVVLNVVLYGKEWVNVSNVDGCLCCKWTLASVDIN